MATLNHLFDLRFHCRTLHALTITRLLVRRKYPRSRQTCGSLDPRETAAVKGPSPAIVYACGENIHRDIGACKTFTPTCAVELKSSF